jgi:hypothetical protein
LAGEPLLELPHGPLEARLVGGVIGVVLGISEGAAVDRNRALDPCPGGFEAVALQQESDSLGLRSRLNGLRYGTIRRNTYSLETFDFSE